MATPGNPQIVTALINTVIVELPNIIDGIKKLFKKHNPSAAEPTEAQVMFAFQTAYISSLAKDDQWLATHPEDQDLE